MLLNGVLRSVLGGRRKRSRRAMRYLGGPLGGSLGSIGGSLLSNPSVLLTAAGVAWGIFETLQQGTRGRRRCRRRPASRRRVPAGTAAAATVARCRSLLRRAGAVIRRYQIVRLAISAACADGSVSDQERRRDSRAGPQRRSGPHRGAGTGAAAAARGDRGGRDRRHSAGDALRAGIRHRSGRRTAKRCRTYLSGETRAPARARSEDGSATGTERRRQRIDAEPEQ